MKIKLLLPWMINAYARVKHTIFKWQWVSSCQPKHKVFYWLMLQDKLVLKRRNMVLESYRICSFYKKKKFQYTSSSGAILQGTPLGVNWYFHTRRLVVPFNIVILMSWWSICTTRIEWIFNNKDPRITRFFFFLRIKNHKLQREILQRISHGYSES